MEVIATSLPVPKEYGDTIPVELLKIADQVRTDTYDRTITDDERIAFGEKVIELSAKVEDRTDEKKATVKMLGDEIKAANSERREILKTLRKGTIEEPDMISTFFDHDTLRVHEYNTKGERVATRRMKPEERQTKLSNI